MAADIVRFESEAAMAADVARRMLELLAQLQVEGRQPQIALTGGGFAHALYEEIARQAGDADVDWSAIDFWWGDERYVAPDSPDRNALQAREALLDGVGASRIHEMPSTSSACSVDEGARAYEAEVRNSPAERFDLVLLSMGPDGHVASLFPDSPQSRVTNRIAVGVTGSPKPPPERITLTFEALNRTDRLWMFAADAGPGGAKEASFQRAMSNDPAIPAAQVHGVVETTWFVS